MRTPLSTKKSDDGYVVSIYPQSEGPGRNPVYELEVLNPEGTRYDCSEHTISMAGLRAIKEAIARL